MTGRAIWALLLGIGLLGACGDAGGDGLRAECETPPLTMRLEALADPPAGGAAVEVTDAVARRVPIVPNPEGGGTSDPEELEAGQEEAATTDLASYSIYLADFEIDRDELESFGFGEVQPEPGGTIATTTIVPTTLDGFANGDVADGSDVEYEATTTFSSLQVIVADDDQDGLLSFDDVAGGIEILHLADDTICVDMDVEILLDDEPVAAARGVVAAPIVRAPDEFFFT